MTGDSRPDSLAEVAVPGLPTTHEVHVGDARKLTMCADGSVALVCCSPPYGDLVTYEPAEGQLGAVTELATFLGALDDVLHECHRVLVAGGRIAFVVGNICRSRRSAGRHHVIPLAAHLEVAAAAAGFDVLTGIKWHKIPNVTREQPGGGRYLGKPNQPNGIIRNELEHIVMARKPGAYRTATPQQRAASHIDGDTYRSWFSPIWTGVNGQRRRDHPAPYPIEIPYRLIRMFSYEGDVVLDPFGGTGTTAVAALACARNSITVDVVELYARRAAARIEAADADVVRRGGAHSTVELTAPADATG